jgi:hypothetical protein
MRTTTMLSHARHVDALIPGGAGRGTPWIAVLERKQLRFLTVF